MRDLDVSLNYIMQFAGTPYRWAGSTPAVGFDCSGLVVEYLQCLGVIGIDDDYTANELLHLLAYAGEPVRGGLVFWGSHGVASHVEIMLTETITIGASGGGRHIKTIDDAIKHNAFVKCRHLRTRKIPLGFRLPVIGAKHE